MRSKPRMSVDDLEKTAQELTRNRLLVEPNIGLPILAERILAEADPDFLVEYQKALAVRDMLRRLRAARGEIIAARKPKRPESLNLLPFWIIGKRGKRVALQWATYTDTREYCKLLSQKLRERQSNSPKLAQAQAMRDALREASARNRSITVQDVFRFE